MGIFSGLAKLFSPSYPSKASDAAETIDYDGYQITPTPQADQGQYRVCALITKGQSDQQQSHTFIRSDLVANRDDCIELTVRKAKLTIDQLGDQIF